MSDVERRIAPLVVLAAAALILISGCAGERPGETTGTPEPTPSTAEVDTGGPPRPYMDAVLTAGDLGPGWVTVRKVIRSPGDVSPRARELGWREGYSVRYADRNASDAVVVDELLSVYPERNISVVMDRAAGSVPGEELELSVGEESVAYRVAGNDSLKYTALFVEGGAFVTVGAEGIEGRESAVESAFRDAAARAAEKLE